MDHGFTPEDLDREAEQDPAAELAAELKRLAALSAIEYDQQREAAAERLGVRVGTLDKEVAKLRPAPEKEAKGRAVKLYTPEPWDEAVQGAAALDATAAALQRHMVMGEEDVTACALWIAHEHAYDAFAHSPRLLVTAPDAECGKTLLMSHLVGSVVTRPLPAEDLSPAPFFRLAEEYKPCFLIDEVDVFIKKDSDLLGALNNGWEPHGCVLRCIGDDNEVRAFSTHTPVVMAGIDLGKRLPATTISRSIVISLDRAADAELSEEDEYDRRRHQPHLHHISRLLARWAADNKEALHQHQPTLPPKVRNRLADKWRPLFAVAELAGGDWPERARKALFAQVDMSEPSKALQLLMDIKEVIPDGARSVSTVGLIDRLCSLEDSVWADYNFRERDQERRRITSRQLAGLLRRYKVHSKVVRDGDRTAKGYDVEELRKAWDRYIPPTTPKKRATGQHSSDYAGSSESYGQQEKNDVAHRAAREASNGAGCCPVAHNSAPQGGSAETQGNNDNCYRYLWRPDVPGNRAGWSLYETATDDVEAVAHDLSTRHGCEVQVRRA